MTQEPLLSISEASQLLGFSEAALRQWTDEGKIKAFITPGGHRRYVRAELPIFAGALLLYSENPDSGVNRAKKEKISYRRNYYISCHRLSRLYGLPEFSDLLLYNQ